MLDHETHVKIADELHRAGIDRVPVPRLTARYPEMEIEDSYAVQRIWAERQVEAGRRKVGHKIGLTSKAMQDATGIDEPDYGVIFDDQVFESGHVYEWKKYTHPRIEMELAFVLRDELRGPGLNLMDVLRATEYVVPALEVLDSRIEMAGRTITDTISDNAALGSLVIGGRPVGLPANGVHWRAIRIAGHGDALEAGEIVLAGSFTRPMWVYQGDTVYADYGPLGTITCRFA